MRTFPMTVLVVACCLPLLSIAQEVRFGGDQDRTVIELFTSEGCSSCPPAEARLNAYVGDPQLWHRVIPLAFHVDYWDDLGWKDRFADPANSARQRAYAARGRLSTVYTPAFVVNGAEWRAHRLAGKPAAASVGPLQVAVRDDGRVQVQPMPAPGPAVLNVVLLGMGLETRITAGENRGRDSEHEFVVLNRSQARVDAAPWQAQVPPSTVAAQRFAVAVWLSREGDPAPLYAAGGYLPARFAPAEFNDGDR